jgi:hypothetical protein
MGLYRLKNGSKGMGSKATFDPLTRIITLTEAPDSNGDVLLDIKVDLYSDGKEDWVADESLRRLIFPLSAVGGNPIPGGALGSSFFIRADWKIRPYNADHRLLVEGNLYAADESDPFLETEGDYTVKVVQKVSALTYIQEVVEVSTYDPPEDPPSWNRPFFRWYRGIGY